MAGVRFIEEGELHGVKRARDRIFSGRWAVAKVFMQHSALGPAVTVTKYMNFSCKVSFGVVAMGAKSGSPGVRSGGAGTAATVAGSLFCALREAPVNNRHRNTDGVSSFFI